MFFTSVLFLFAIEDWRERIYRTKNIVDIFGKVEVENLGGSKLKSENCAKESKSRRHHAYVLPLLPFGSNDFNKKHVDFCYQNKKHVD